MNQKQDLQIISILGQTQIGYTKPFEDYLITYNTNIKKNRK